MTIDEAAARQWLRDNKGNLAWSYLKMVDPSNLDHIINCGYELVAELVDSELGAGTYERYTKREGDSADELGLERCESCHEMVADPIDSQQAGGKLCRGCMRWYEHYDKRNPEIDLSWQVWAGRSCELLKLIEQIARAQDEAKKAEAQWWADLRKQVKGNSSKAKTINVRTDDEDYQRHVDARLSHGEDWRVL